VDYTQRTSKANLERDALQGSLNKFSIANDTLFKVSHKADTITQHLDTIKTLMDGRLKRCEDNTPTFWERLYQVAGAGVLGLLLGVLLTK
jgi:hypothetical protein